MLIVDKYYWLINILELFIYLQTFMLEIGIVII